MGLELVATFAIGFAAAGVAMLINWLLGKRLPRWIVPVSAGGAMIAFAIFSEYAWFGRTKAALPEGIVVAHSVEEQVFYRPWTYVIPYVDRFIAVDRVSLRQNENFPDHKILDLLVYGRWAPVNRIRSIFDCANGRRADLTDGVSFTEEGELQGATWYNTGLDDPVTKTACETG
ncbi:MAG: hypothetical protein AAGE61_12865 [Pseudomonadota bacterium]